MTTTYFPDPVSGWVFFALLMSLLAIASYTDQLSMVVPKWLTLPLLALGILANLLRGAWLGSHELPVWSMGSPGPWLGALDGLLFSLVGFTVGLALFLLMWILGVCGGGDVKLFAALGAWIGPGLVVWVLVLTVLMLAGYMFFLILGRLLAGESLLGLAKAPQPSPRRGAAGKKPKSSPRLVRYSLVVALATAPVLLWAFRVDLHLASAPRATPAEEVHSHAP